MLRRHCAGEQVTAHAVGGGGIEAVACKEAAGRIGGEKLSVKEHGHQIGVLGAKFHIVGHHHNGDAAALQTAQDTGQLALEKAVKALGRLIQQQ